MKTWIKRTLIALAGALARGGALAACGHRHHHGWHSARSSCCKAVGWPTCAP